MEKKYLVPSLKEQPISKLDTDTLIKHLLQLRDSVECLKTGIQSITPRILVVHNKINLEFHPLQISSKLTFLNKSYFKLK